ncbi:MAG: hypothetical protein JSS27_11835 [Planctomycetes bacterium]|nr:hypothetical protein [Planctomycetota bacterium]
MGIFGSLFGCAKGDGHSHQAPASHAPFKLFFVDYVEDKTLESKDARAATKAEILHSMDCVLHMPRNFVGLIDRNDMTLQFMVNDDKTIHVDVPVPSRTGSFVKTATLKECLDLVSTLGDSIDVAKIGGLTFTSWNAK